jgi:hypothetical protein
MNAGSFQQMISGVMDRRYSKRYSYTTVGFLAVSSKSE